MEKDNRIIPAIGEAKNKIVETYAEDMAKVIEDDRGGGLIKKIIHGEEEHEKEKIKLSPESKKNKFFMLVGFLFILIGLVTLIYFLNGRVASTVPVEQQFTPLIFNDKSIFIEVKDFDKDKIAHSVLNEVIKAEVKPGGVKGIYPTFNKQIMGLRQLLSLIKSNFIPGSNIFVNDNFLMGVVVNDTNPASSAGRDFFILLKVHSTVDVFDALRAWESKMFFDLHGFFGVDITPQTKYLLTKEFENGIVENKNARILYDKDNKIVLMYILANDTSVVFTNTENAAHELMLRLAASQVKQ